MCGIGESSNVHARYVRCMVSYDRKCPPDDIPLTGVYTIYHIPGGITLKILIKVLYFLKKNIILT